jgi:hypothetical protein
MRPARVALLLYLGFALPVLAQEVEEHLEPLPTSQPSPAASTKVLPTAPFPEVDRFLAGMLNLEKVFFEKDDAKKLLDSDKSKLAQSAHKSCFDVTQLLRRNGFFDKMDDDYRAYRRSKGESVPSRVPNPALEEYLLSNKALSATLKQFFAIYETIPKHWHLVPELNIYSKCLGQVAEHLTRTLKEKSYSEILATGAIDRFTQFTRDAASERPLIFRLWDAIDRLKKSSDWQRDPFLKQLSSPEGWGNSFINGAIAEGRFFPEVAKTEKYDDRKAMYFYQAGGFQVSHILAQLGSSGDPAIENALQQNKTRRTMFQFATEPTHGNGSMSLITEFADALAVNLEALPRSFAELDEIDPVLHQTPRQFFTANAVQLGTDAPFYKYSGNSIADGKGNIRWCVVRIQDALTKR